MAKTVTNYRKPFYILNGRKVSDRSYVLPFELPFTSEKLINHLISSNRKFEDLMKIVRHTGLKLSKYDKAR